MPPSTETPQPQPLPRSIFEIRPGLQLILSITGFDDRVRTACVGHERGRYFLMRLPSAATQGLPGLYEYLYQGNMATVSYLHDGNIWGFSTRIQSYALRPYPLLFADFPARIDSHNLRKESRIECLFPVQIQAGAVQGQAMLLDISRNGCRLACDPSDPLARLAVGDTVEMECAIFNATGAQSLGCQVRGAQSSGGRTTLGLAFTSVPEAVGRSIDGYLRTVAGLLDDAPPAAAAS